MKTKAGPEMTRAPRHKIPASCSVPHPSRVSCGRVGILAFAMLSILGWSAHAQTCLTSSDMDDATRSAITAAAQRYFTMAASADTASLQQNSIASLAGNFSAIEDSLKSQQPDLTGAQAKVSSLFLLEEQGVAPDPHAEFYCGVFGKNGQTPTSAAFYLNNLPPGKYGAAVIEAVSSKARMRGMFILQQEGTYWKLAGLYMKRAEIGGHDSDWYAARAREYKSKGELHNATLYYQEATNLLTPVSFMSTLATDKLYDEAQTAQAPDLPSNGKTIELIAGGATYKVSEIYPAAIGNDLNLIVKYQVSDATNANQCFQSNVDVMKALLLKFPELRDAFSGVNTRAIDSSGRLYSTLMPMKNIK